MERASERNEQVILYKDYKASDGDGGGEKHPLPISISPYISFYHQTHNIHMNDDGGMICM